MSGKPLPPRCPLVRPRSCRGAALAACLLAGGALGLAAPSAAQTRLFVAPVPADDAKDAAPVLTRAIESAVLELVRDVEVVTPRGLDQKMELDLLRACAGDGDDASCAVELASALGVDLVLRSQLSRLGGRVILTVSLFDGKNAALLAQGQRQADAGRPEALLDEAKPLVAEVVAQGGLAVRRPAPAPAMPLGPLALVGGGAAVGVLGVGAAAVAVVVDAQYLDGRFDRGTAGTWEIARLGLYAAGGAAVVTGAGLIGLGAILWE